MSRAIEFSAVVVTDQRLYKDLGHYHRPNHVSVLLNAYDYPDDFFDDFPLAILIDDFGDNMYRAVDVFDLESALETLQEKCKEREEEGEKDTSLHETKEVVEKMLADANKFLEINNLNKNQVYFTISI